jgi:hypothetical protein
MNAKKVTSLLTVLILFFNTANLEAQSSGCKMAIIDTKKSYGEDDPLVKRYNNMFTQLSAKYVETEERIADMTLQAKNELEKIGLRESMISIMEGICRLTDRKTKSKKYADNVSCYLRFRAQGFDHSEALIKIQDLLSVMAMESIVKSLAENQN